MAEQEGDEKSTSVRVEPALRKNWLMRLIGLESRPPEATGQPTTKPAETAVPAAGRSENYMPPRPAGAGPTGGDLTAPRTPTVVQPGDGRRRD